MPAGDRLVSLSSSGTLPAPVVEAIQDAVASMLVSGGNLTLSYNDTTGKITVTGSDPANTYANAVTGSRYTILYNGTAWPVTRPDARTDIYFDLIGGSAAVADPAWMINGDAREITV